MFLVEMSGGGEKRNDVQDEDRDARLEIRRLVVVGGLGGEFLMRGDHGGPREFGDEIEKADGFDIGMTLRGRGIEVTSTIRRAILR